MVSLWRRKQERVTSRQTQLCAAVWRVIHCRATMSFRSFKNLKRHRTGIWLFYPQFVTNNKSSQSKMILPAWNEHIKPKKWIRKNAFNLRWSLTKVGWKDFSCFNTNCLLDSQRIQKADILAADVCLYCTSKCSRDMKEDDTFYFFFVNCYITDRLPKLPWSAVKLPDSKKRVNSVRLLF